jgi:hypothetical protein
MPSISGHKRLSVRNQNITMTCDPLKDSFRISAVSAIFYGSCTQNASAILSKTAIGQHTIVFQPSFEFMGVANQCSNASAAVLDVIWCCQ